MSYLSVSGETVTEQTIEKSRFIAVSNHIECEEEAKAFIERLKIKFRDATHCCYAYIADECGNFPRFSDDGEPQGTAGMPMLEVIKNNNLKQIVVAVIRYFGGIKLGAGGLLRAYSGAVAANLAAAKKVRYEPCVKCAFEVDYTKADLCQSFFLSRDCTVMNTDYADKVTFTVAVRKRDEQDFNGSLLDKLSGKVRINKLEEYLFPFNV